MDGTRTITTATRFSTAGRSWLAIAAIACASAVAGCEEGEPAMVVSYVDSAGRSCTVDVYDISQTASCDVDPSTLVTCEAGQEAAIVVNDDYDFETRIYTLESCAGCVDRAARMTYLSSDLCVNVTCETDADCIYERYTCQTGICRRM